MKLLILDVETTGATNGTFGNPFTISNKLCCIGSYSDDSYYHDNIEYNEKPYGRGIASISSRITPGSFLVGFNIKFDLHWLRRYGINFEQCRVWDCQLVEFILNNQSTPYPSLEGVSIGYNLGNKYDVVRKEYWEKGIDTDKVPEPILREYVKQDVMLTYEIYLRQLEEVKKCSKEKQTLMRLSNQDLLVLQEMEFNGMPYNLSKSLEKASELGIQITELDKNLVDLTGLDFVNFNSGDALSCILYGGTLKENYRESFVFTYKDGRTKQKERWAIREHILPTLVEPLPKTKLKKEGFYKTDEGTLRKLKGNKKVQKLIKLLLERAKLEKLKSTYYEGFPKLHTEMEWEPDFLHGQLIQCNAATGRLSSSKPNQQNIPEEVRALIKTRYP